MERKLCYKVFVVCLWTTTCHFTAARTVVRSECLHGNDGIYSYQSRTIPRTISPLLSPNLLSVGESASQNGSDIAAPDATDTSNGTDVDTPDCIPSGIHSFPRDFFSQRQRRQGGVLVHLFILFYACAVIASVCDDYFIPSLEIISDKLKLPPDVAGATFMAIGASSPELFSSIIGSFVTKGDIGVGAVIGSAVFNILGITGVVGILLWKEVLDIDWYPMARDCLAYTVTVLCLVWIISDNRVMWWEALVLLCIFLLYILLMYFNGRVERCSRKLVKKIGPDICCCCNCEENGEAEPLLTGKKPTDYSSSQERTRDETKKDRDSRESSTTRVKARISKSLSCSNSVTELDAAVTQRNLCTPPSTLAGVLWWLLMLPANTLLCFSVPDVENPRFRSLFPITFIMSVVWLGVLSYVAVWMVTIIGYTFSIPDSVSGLTILAVGASVPDLIATVLVAKSGEGNMAMSNLVGSNNFDISICLGIPWIAKALLTEEGYVQLYSSALSYAAAILLLTLLLFYMVFQCNGWKLNRSVGLICLLIYGVFLVFACLFEFNIFGYINPPTCYP